MENEDCNIYCNTETLIRKALSYDPTSTREFQGVPAFGSWTRFRTLNVEKVGQLIEEQQSKFGVESRGRGLCDGGQLNFLNFMIFKIVSA